MKQRWIGLLFRGRPYHEWVGEVEELWEYNRNDRLLLEKDLHPYGPPLISDRERLTSRSSLAYRVTARLSELVYNIQFPPKGPTNA